jgi:hypothetical protein
VTPAGRVQILAGRFTSGWAICDQKGDPERLVTWKEPWITRLHEYEDLCVQASSTMTAKVA